MANANGGLVKVGNIGDTSASTATLTISPLATLTNSNTGTNNGGAVYVNAYGSLIMTGGNITKNECAGDGAGIYLAENANMSISQSPVFGDEAPAEPLDPLNPGEDLRNLKSGVSLVNGGTAYANRVRQDIFIAGYESADGATNATSLTVAGNIGSGNGSIWVWAEKTPHHKTEQQFAKYTEDVTEVETTLAAFRNARDDEDTGAAQVGNYLYGIKMDEDTGRNVFWSGIEGTAHVILVKVGEVDNSYEELSGVTFTVYTSYTDAEHNTVAKGTVLTNSGAIQENYLLENLTTFGGGALFIGELPYGTYYAMETITDDPDDDHDAYSKGYRTTTKLFTFDVNEGGVVEIDASVNPKKMTPIKIVSLE